MPEPLQLLLNGQPRSFPDLPERTALTVLIDTLGMKADRIAVEHNGSLAPRSTWANVLVGSGDKLEIVHFVGGGLA